MLTQENALFVLIMQNSYTYIYNVYMYVYVADIIINNAIKNFRFRILSPVFFSADSLVQILQLEHTSLRLLLLNFRHICFRIISGFLSLSIRDMRRRLTSINSKIIKQQLPIIIVNNSIHFYTLYFIYKL